MSNMMTLKALLLNAMSDLITTYGLAIIEVSDSEVLLKARTFTIDVFMDKESVDMVYFDTRYKPMKGYNITRFLLNRRRDRLTFSANTPEPASYSDFIEGQLNSLIQHIRSAGLDILSGADDWMKSYSWPTVQAQGSAAALI